MNKTQFSFVTVVALSIFIVSFQNCGADFVALKTDAMRLGSELGVVPGAKQDNPFICENPTNMAARPIKRLSKNQYSNTLAALIGKPGQTAVVGRINTLYDDTLKKEVGDFSNTITDTQMTAYQIIAEGVQTYLRANPAVVQSLGGTCLGLATVTPACRDEAIQKNGLKAFRRPLTSAEVTRMTLAFALGANGVESFAYTIYAMMLSPQFLLHLELGSDASAAEPTFDLTPYEVASRISYGLVDGPPDAALYAAAAAGTLSNVDQVRPHVDRLVLTVDGKAKIRRFFTFWLDPKSYGVSNYGADFLQGLDVAAANTEFEREMYEYIDYIVFEKNGSFDDLILSRESFARTPATAAIYGHAAVTGAAPAVTSAQRKGLFMRTPILSGDSNETHPIMRGVKIRARLLCESVGIPVDALMSDPTFFTDAARLRMSTRDRTTGLTASASCMGCHASINPVGFAFENFDSFGRVRTKERAYSTTNTFLAEHAIETKSDSINLGGGARSISDGLDVIDGMAKHNQLAGCFVRQVTRFYRIQQESGADACYLREIYDKGLVSNQTPVIDAFKSQFLQQNLFKRKM